MKTIRIFLLIIGNSLALLLALLALETTPTNFMGWFLFAISITYGVGGVVYLWRTRPEEESTLSENDRRSFWAIMPGFVAVFFIPPIEFLFLPLLPHVFGLEIAGLIIILLGLGLRVWTRTISGQMYSGYLRIRVGHVLIREGPYRLIRHPGYAGFVLMAIGMCLGYCSLIGLAAILLLLIPGLAYRIRVEERLLDEHFGEEYHAYACRTKKLIPGIW